MITFTINDKTITVPKGTKVYEAAKQLGIDIPIFCYHDRMPAFGACRVCLVEVEKMPKLQASCTLEAVDGMVVRTQSQMAIDGREEILEFLLINHPLDCPICDKGGECPLQEQALNFGPGESRFFEEKRRFKKPIPLGPVLMLDRERCIACARCTRFGEEIAGDHALVFIDRGYKTEVGTPGGAPVESKFIGNTISICPVGALTSQVYRFRARPWDNETTKSTCTLCPVGCSLLLDARDGEMMRTRPCENREINDVWLCDKGYFGYEFTSHPDRLQKPLIRKNGFLKPASWDEALQLIATKLTLSKTVAAFGGDPLTAEEQDLLNQLIPTQQVSKSTAGMETKIADCENLDFAILLGLDLTEEFPVIWLRLKQAINKGANVTFIGHYAPEIASQLTNTVLHSPGCELKMIREELPKLLQSGKKGALFVGSQYLHRKNRNSILNELTKISVPLNIMEEKSDSDYQREIIETAQSKGFDFLYVAGCNPAKKFPTELWKEARKNLKFLVVQDIFLSETAQTAHVVLPTLSYIEKGGSFINIEGSVQTLQPGKMVPEGLYSDGEIFSTLGILLKKSIAPKKVEPKPFKRPANCPPDGDDHEVTLAATFAPVLFDRSVRMRHNTHLIQQVKEPKIRIHTNEATKRNLKCGDHVRVSVGEYSLTGTLQVDSKVAEKTVVLPKTLPIQELGMRYSGFEVELTKVEQ